MRSAAAIGVGMASGSVGMCGAAAVAVCTRPSPDQTRRRHQNREPHETNENLLHDPVCLLTWFFAGAVVAGRLAAGLRNAAGLVPGGSFAVGWANLMRVAA